MLAVEPGLNHNARMQERYRNLDRPEFFNPNFHIAVAVRQAAERGYYFESGVMTDEVLREFEEEVNSLNMEFGDHVSNPIYAGTKKEIQQLHDRFYSDIYDPLVPVAHRVAVQTAAWANQMTYIDPGILDWLPNEVGYQRYAQGEGHITPHRDRRNDQILAFTITIAGSNVVRIHEPAGDPDDYTNLRQVDEFRTSPGSVMFLRAPGLGSGEQIIHSVLPPENGSRLILNLRMRPDILPPPAFFEAA